ncbi:MULTISPECIES: NHLP leader peptide family RiPP precursor [unclassified Microcoleus]|uniref:NHLP leader peptide family RiPP precursor n=1 Tax=unclassified Microcoleus TaxID=2642155 RepID=UPI002FCFDD40
MTVQNAELKQRQELAAKFIAKAWESDNFKQELISNPKAIFAKVLDSPVPDNVQIQVLEETSSTYYLVIPNKPEVVEELSDEALDAVAGGAKSVTTCGHTYTAEL